MNAKQLIEQVNECAKNSWQNSDLWKESQEMLEKIAEHFENCEECRKEFDALEYPEETLIEFEDRLARTEITDWICDFEDDVNADDLDTSEIVMEALTEIAKQDKTSVKKLWENGYTKIHNADEVSEIVVKYIRENVKPEEIEEYYNWGIEKVWME